MQSLESIIGNFSKPLYNATKPNSIYYRLFDDDIEDDDVNLPYVDELIYVKFEEISDAYLEALDEYIRAEIVIPGRDALPVLGKFKKRKRDAYGNLMENKNSNPILDTRIYELEFPDERIEEFAVNDFTKNLFNQADLDGWDTGLIDEVIDNRKYPSIAVAI